MISPGERSWIGSTRSDSLATYKDGNARCAVARRIVFMDAAGIFVHFVLLIAANRATTINR